MRKEVIELLCKYTEVLVHLRELPSSELVPIFMTMLAMLGEVAADIVEDLETIEIAASNGLIPDED